MMRFWFKCLCSFSLIISTLYAAPTSNGIHRVSRQDFTSNGAPQGAAASYQRPFESQNGVYRVQRQDFTNVNDIPFYNSYQSPYMNRFSLYNSGYGNTNRSYMPYPKLFVPANSPRPENPYLAIGLPNYERIVPASSFQAKTKAPQVTIYDDDSVLPAVLHPPRYDLSSVSQKTSSFEEDFSSAVEQFDMTEDRKAICKGANCRKSNPNDDADAVKPIRRRRSIDFDPSSVNPFRKSFPSGFYRSRYTWNRYPMHRLDDYEDDSIFPPRVHFQRKLYYPVEIKRTAVEPTSTKFEINNEETETPYSTPDSIDYEVESTSTPEPPAKSTTAPCNIESEDQEFTDEFSQRIVRSEEVTEPDNQEFTDEFSQRVARSEQVTTPTSEPKELEFEYNDSYAPLPAINSGSTTPRDKLVMDYPTREDVLENHSVYTRESSTDLDLNSHDVDDELASIDWQFHRGTVEATTETEDSEKQTEVAPDYTTEELTEYSTPGNYWPEDHSIHARESSTDSDLNTDAVSTDWYFHRETIEPMAETDDTETQTESTSESYATEQQPEYPTPGTYWPEDHSIHTRESSTDSDLNSDTDGMNFTPIACEFFDKTTEPVTESETTSETEAEPTEQQTEYPPNSEILSYSLSTLIICNMWPEKYNKKFTDMYNPNDQSWASLCNFLNLKKLKDIEPETTTTEAVNTDFLDEHEIFGIGVETIGEDFQNLLDVIETMQIGNAGGDIWPELPEIDYDNGNSSPPLAAETVPEVITLDV